MKKIYSTPLTEVVKLKVRENMLEASTKLVDEDAESDALGKYDGEYDSWAW